MKALKQTENIIYNGPAPRIWQANGAMGKKRNFIRENREETKAKVVIKGLKVLKELAGEKVGWQGT
ncbi:MAG: hypothetical protein ACK559_01755, partial [bacterium]